MFERTAPGAGTTSASYGWINAHRTASRSYHELTLAPLLRRLAAQEILREQPAPELRDFRAR